MPYLKQREDPIVEVLNAKRLDGPSLAKILGCTAPTARRKLRDPELLTLGDLRKISRFAHINIDKIREAI